MRTIHRMRYASEGNQRGRIRAKRLGTTLLELTVASTILAVTLIPALRLLRDSLRQSRQLVAREVMATLCQGQVEQQSLLIATQWKLTSGVDRQSGLESGFPNVLVAYSASDDSSRGGISDRLAALTVTAFDDANGNSRRDPDEPGVEFATKIARLTTLEYEGRGS